MAKEMAVVAWSVVTVSSAPWDGPITTDKRWWSYGRKHVETAVLQKKHKKRTHIDLRNFEWWWKFATVHDDVIKWKHFSSCFVCRMHRSPVNSPNKGQWRGTLVFSFICAWINGWLNNRGAGDFRRHRAHYDVILMKRNGIEVVSDKVSRQ